MSMLHEVGLDLRTQLRNRGCMFPVHDGPEIRGTDTGGRERIILEYDMTGTESFAPKMQNKLNPTARYTRNMVCKATIYAKSPRAGALYMEHQRRAEHVLDHVIVGMLNVSSTRKNIFKPTSGRFIFPEDLKESETPGFAVYQLFFTLDRGVFDQNWDFSPDPTAEVVAAQADPPVAGQVTISNSTTVADTAGDTESA